YVRLSDEHGQNVYRARDAPGPLRARLACAGGRSRSRAGNGIAKCDRGGAWSRRFTAGGLAPDLAPGVTYSSIYRAEMNSASQVAFAANLEGARRDKREPRGPVRIHARLRNSAP